MALTLGAEQLPPISETLQPSTTGTMIISLFFATFGVLGGALAGVATGAVFVDRRLAKDEESRARIMAALQRYRIGERRKRAEILEASLSDSDSTRT